MDRVRGVQGLSSHPRVRGQAGCMDEVREQRWGAVSGFAALVLAAVAVGYERSVPDPDRTPAEVLDFYVRNGSELLAQSLLFVLSSGIFLWFLGNLHTFLARIEGRPARLASIAYAAGIPRHPTAPGPATWRAG